MLQGLNVWEYFQVDESVIEQMYGMLEPSPPSMNIFVEDPSIQIQKMMNHNLVGLGAKRYGVTVANL